MGSGEKLTQLRYRPAQLWNDELLEAVARVVVDLVALAEVLDADGDVGTLLGSRKLGEGSRHGDHQDTPNTCQYPI